ncbi:MAG TPA: hypothetical protein VIL85_26840 [Thermomicrobiales bacterium]|jgi:hypothetical protein
MTEQQRSLLPFYAGWGRYQWHLVAAIAPLTVDQLALRTTPRHWTIGMYATHIVANRAWWLHARMGEGGDELTPYELWTLGVCEADVDPGHTAAELVTGLEQTWRMIEGTLASLTPPISSGSSRPWMRRDASATRNGSSPRSSHTPECGWMGRVGLAQYGLRCHSSRSSGAFSSTTSITAAKSPPPSASTACRSSSWITKPKR